MRGKREGDWSQVTWSSAGLHGRADREKMLFEVLKSCRNLKSRGANYLGKMFLEHNA